MNLWGIFVAVGVLTFVTRFSFIALSGRFQPPEWFVAMLPFVPIAALTALMAPDLLLVAGTVEFGPGNARLWAGGVAIAVAAWRKNTLLTIGSGFAALWIVQALN